MAVLTWRNVDAPQGGGTALEGLGMAARLLSNASGGISDALGNYNQAQTTLANNAFAQAASQYQDSDSLKAALANGSLLGSLQGVDPSKVSASAIGAQDSRVGTLINDASNQQKLDEANYNFGLQKTQNDNLIAAEPAVAALTAAGSDPAKQAAVYANPDFASALSKLTPDQQFGIQSKATSNGTAGLQLLQSARNDQYDQQSQAALAQILQTPTDALGAQQRLQAMNLPAPVYLATRAKLTQAGYVDPTNPANAGALGMGGPIPLTAPSGAAGAIAGAAGGSGPAGAASADGASGFDTTYGNGKYAKPPAPISTMPISSVLDWQKNSLIPATQGQLKDAQGNVLKGSDGKPLGTSAVGAYQLTDQTIENYAPKVLGDDWKNQNLGPQQQDKIAEAAFNASKNGNLHAIWPTLPDSTPGAYKDVPWDQMRQRIAAAESSTPGQSLLDQLNNANIANTVTQAGIQTRNQQNITALNIDPAAWKTATDDPTTSPTAMAQKLIADPKSVYYKSDQNSVQKMLESAQTQYASLARDKDFNPTGNNLNLAQLALLIGNHLNPGASGLLSGLGNAIRGWGGNTLVGGQSVNDTGLQEGIKNALQGLPAGAAGAQTDLAQKSNMLNSATQLYQQAYSRYATLANLKARGVTIDDDALNRALNDMNVAKAQVNSAQAYINTPPAGSPPGTPPTAVPLGQSDMRAKVKAALDAKTQVDAAAQTPDGQAQAAALAAALEGLKYQ
jgi:hypothetical protein